MEQPAIDNKTKQTTINIFYFLSYMVIFYILLICIASAEDIEIGNFREMNICINPPYNLEKIGDTYYRIRSRSVCTKNSVATTGFGFTKNIFEHDDINSEFKNISKDKYYIGPWVYYPKIGKYLRYAGFIDGSFEEQTPENIKYKEQQLNQGQPITVISRNSGMNILNSNIMYWMKNVGYNCYCDMFNTDINNCKIKCYNELDTSDYERYIYYGTSSKEERDAYIKFYNVKPLSSYFINKKYIKENKKSWILPENKKEKRKILIMVPKDQVKYFIKDIKTIPDNALKGLEGYVWFLSEPINRDITQMHKVNIKKYDVKPNDKYDAELYRISGGKLKAKYGRYLTKERYSEDYVAPSIYGNNYNDMPEW